MIKYQLQIKQVSFRIQTRLCLKGYAEDCSSNLAYLVRMISKTDITFILIKIFSSELDPQGKLWLILIVNNTNPRLVMSRNNDSLHYP